MVLEFFSGLPGIISALPYGSEITAALIILLFVVIAKAFNWGLLRSVHSVTRKTETRLDDIVLESVKRPIFVGILLFGIYLATGYITFLAGYASELSMGFSIIYTLYALWFAMRIANAAIEWYSTDIAAKTKTKKDEQFIPIIKKVLMAVFGFIALLMILGQFGIEITTLVAALGIGGLAVALALQPTLANFFSGAHILMDKVVRIGDFVELDDITKGTVVDISWRSTKIRTFSNNILIIPNSKMADTVITAYNQPVPEYGFTVACGVSYNDDLDKVERVTLQVARKIMKMEGAAKGFEPFVRFKEFGDSNINFSVILRAKDRGSSFLLRHEFIKALKKAFDKEKITIEWPVRKIYYGDKQVLKTYKRKK